MQLWLLCGVIARIYPLCCDRLNFNVLVGYGDSTHRLHRRQHDVILQNFYPLHSLPTLTKYFTFYSVSAFSFYLKKKTPAKEKQTQGFAPRPRERRAAVHRLLFSVGSSAHSPVNSLRSNSTVSCGLLCKPSPRSSQIACSTAARLLEACSSKFIKSLTLPCGKCPYSLFFVFCVFRKAASCRINLGRIIFAFTRFNIRQPLYFCGRAKVASTVYLLQPLCKSQLQKAFIFPGGTVILISI